MNLQNVDWVKFLKDDSLMTTDISFKVYDNGSVLAKVHDDLGSEMTDMFKLFRAHKFLLAIVSEPFHGQFFGPLAEMADPVIVKQTSSKAFGIMLDYIYQKDEQFSFTTEHFSCLFEIRNLGEKYGIAGLVNKTEEEISTCQLSTDNLMEAVKSAQNYGHLFAEISKSLMDRCQIYFAETYTTLEKIRKLANDHKDSKIDTDLIMMMIQAEPANCPGCKRIVSKCLNGEQVTKHNVKVGVQVTRDAISNASHFRMEASHGIGIITRPDEFYENRGGERWYVRWGNGVENGDWPIKNGAYFVFKCR